MRFTTKIGTDDPTSTKTPATQLEMARAEAEMEIDTVVKEFDQFMKGTPGPWAIDSSRLTNRLDVKYCVPLQGRLVDYWKQSGLEVSLLKDLVEPVEGRIIFPKEEPDQEYLILEISYSGKCRTTPPILGKDLGYEEFIEVQEGDLVFSTINAVNGAVAIVGKTHAGALASQNYTVLRCKESYETPYLWSVLRSSEIRADLLSITTGFGRHYLNWPEFGEVSIPLLPTPERRAISEQLTKSWIAEEEAALTQENAIFSVTDRLGIESKESIWRYEAAKPPR